MKYTIIGKQPLKTEPKFDKKNSIGLNHAALWYNTEYAMTGHEWIYRQFLEAKLTKIILIDPLFEGKTLKSYDSIGYDMDESRNPDNSVKSCEKYVKSAIRGENIQYPNRLSILHLALFYVLKKGAKEVELLGCANNYNQFREYNEFQKETTDIMHEFTSSMVECMRSNGIKVNWVIAENGTFRPDMPIDVQPKLPDLTILSLKGYFIKHFKLCATAQTQQDAFDELELEYSALTGKNRYNSYEAFRTAKSRYYADKNNR